MRRIAYVDYAKALCILLMIVGHRKWGQIPYVTDFIYTFHMPMFMILAGFFIKPLSIADGIRKYGKSYLRPFIVTALISLAVLMGVGVCKGVQVYDMIGSWFVRTIFSSGYEL